MDFTPDEKELLYWLSERGGGSRWFDAPKISDAEVFIENSTSEGVDLRYVQKKLLQRVLGEIEYYHSAHQPCTEELNSIIVKYSKEGPIEVPQGYMGYLPLEKHKIKVSQHNSYWSPQQDTNGGISANANKSGQSETKYSPNNPTPNSEQQDLKVLGPRKKIIDILIPYAMVMSIYTLIFLKNWYPNLLDLGFSIVFALVGISCFIFPEQLARMRSWRNAMWGKTLGRKGLVKLIKYVSSSLCLLFAILMITEGAEAIF